MSEQPRDGKAVRWDTETVLSEAIAIPIGNESVGIEVCAEVPIGADGHRVHRRGNRYYPTFVDVEVSDEKLILHAETARKLAAALVRAADAVDSIDDPCTDTCGHWYPCDCGAAKETR